MTKKQLIKITLITGLFSLSLGGWLLHMAFHPVSRNTFNLIPFLSGIMSVFLLPLLFWFRRTVALAYILEGFSVILGSILMTHYGIVHFQGPLTLSSLLLTTTFPDVAVLVGKFGLGKALFDVEYFKADTDLAAKGHFYRFPHMGWWWVHLIGLSLLYLLGSLVTK